MGKNAKKSRKNKAMKVNQAKQKLAQESVSAATTAQPKNDALQEPVKPIEEKTVPVVVAAVPVKESKKIDEVSKSVEKGEKKPKTEKADAKKTDKTKPVKKPAAKTAAPKTAKKTPVVKAEPAKRPGRKPMTAAEKAANAKARAEEKKKADAMTPTLTMQYGGRDINVKALVQAAKDDFKANHKRTLLTELNLYLKPEDSTMYYVANGSVEGKISF